MWKTKYITFTSGTRTTCSPVEPEPLSKKKSDIHNPNEKRTWSELMVELYELKEDILATSSMEVAGCCSRGAPDIEMTGGGGGAFAFFLRGVLPGRFGVLVAIEDLYIELEAHY